MQYQCSGSDLPADEKAVDKNVDDEEISDISGFDSDQGRKTDTSTEVIEEKNVEDENMSDVSVVESDQDRKTSTPTRGPRGKKRKAGWDSSISLSPVRDLSSDSKSVQAEGDKVGQAAGGLSAQPGGHVGLGETVGVNVERSGGRDSSLGEGMEAVGYGEAVQEGESVLVEPAIAKLEGHVGGE